MMTKRLLPVLCFFFAVSLSYGQNAANPVARLDDAVKSLAADISKKIPAGENQRVAVNAWTYYDSAPAFSFYWAAQLAEELTNISGRSFILAAGGPVAADWTLSGEIIEAAGVIRVYTRLIRSGDHAVAASFHSDFEPGDYLVEMLSTGGSSSGGRSSVARDSYEVDSFENPLAVEIAVDSGGPVINRTIHIENELDFFLLTPNRDGALVMETTGDMDTIMKLYNASEIELASNDDGGSGSNARIRHRVRSGERYIARVRNYGSGTGRYGFRAWLTEDATLSADEYEDDNDCVSAKEISIGTPQQHTFTTGSDVDWVTFSIDRAGRYVIRTRGVNSTRLDTYIELYDSDLNLVGENDDGGEDYDSRLSVHLQAGTYYLKAGCLNDEPEEPYTIRIDAE
jgi:hypothetical protein